jgi:threonine synthase
LSYRAYFQCIRPGCGHTHRLNEVVYHCSVCGSLLEVRHDLEALRARSASSWMRLFDDRYKTGQWPYGSAIWGKKEWVLPEIDNENVVSMYEGHSNLFWAERLGRCWACATCGSSSAASAIPAPSRTWA